MVKSLKHPRRTEAEARLVSSHFGSVDFTENIIIVDHFDLPPGFNVPRSRLLLELPRNYPEQPPLAVYLDKGLRYHRTKPKHYFEDFVGKKFCRKGYAWYCLHIKSWRPNAQSMIRGDNLLTYIEAVYRALKNGK